MQNTEDKETNLFFSKILSLFTVINLEAVLENMKGQFSSSLKIMATIFLLLNHKLTGLCNKLKSFNAIVWSQQDVT